jgi:hypothetical protein
VGNGKLILHSACKAYGARVLIQAQTIMTANNTKDIVPPLTLDYEYCTFGRKTTKLDDIHLELPLGNIVNCLEDLRLASHKAEEVDKLISEQEWKTDSHLSFLSYVGVVTTSLFMIFLCYCCCKCCKRRFPSFSKWWKDNNPCTTIVIKPKIINSGDSSRGGLRIPNTSASSSWKPSQGDTIEKTTSFAEGM